MHNVTMKPQLEQYLKYLLKDADVPGLRFNYQDNLYLAQLVSSVQTRVPYVASIDQYHALILTSLKLLKRDVDDEAATDIVWTVDVNGRMRPHVDYNHPLHVHNPALQDVFTHTYLFIERNL